MCDCGNEKVIDKYSLTNKATKSCGCLLTEFNNTRKVQSAGHENRIYRIWHGMKNRCKNPNSKDYPNYGGRGITVCEEWDTDFRSFRSWAFENGYSDDLSIDRIDNNKGYSPSNCRWADLSTQNSNRRVTTVEIRGKQMSFREIANEFNINYSTLYGRYQTQGLRGEDLISPPHQGMHVGRKKIEKK